MLRRHSLARLRRSPILRSRLLRLLVIIAFLFIYLILPAPKRQKHEITQAEIKYEAVRTLPLNASIGEYGYLHHLEAKKICKAMHWPVWEKREERRKVYLLLMINDELDWLEIQLSTLYSSVDYFVLVESSVTFTNLPKDLHLAKEMKKGRYKEWEQKIVYHVVEDPPIGSKRAWDYEDHQRNAMFSQTFSKFEGNKKAVKGDVIIVADIDEVVRPATIMVLRNCHSHRRVTIRSQFYYYGFQFLHIGPQWPHPQATLFGGLGRGDTILPNDLRIGDGGWKLLRWREKVDLWNGGWHCSTCFASVEEVLTKMRSFSHRGLNQEAFREPTRIVDRVRKGLDLWDREGEKYTRIWGNNDVPPVLHRDMQRWSYLLERDGNAGGFKDYHEWDVPGE